MSGIAGVYHADGRAVAPSLLEWMSQAMAHRGPDGEGRWASGPIGLIHRLLHTTPESLKERQPVSDDSGRYQLVWDGRLDNREELIAALGAERIDLGAQTDPELVLGAYRRWGVDCLKRIIGEFAFALWDERTRSLFCARDRMGLKPLHYSWDGTTLLISSEMKPLFEARGVTPEPDDEMILAFLLREFRERDHGRTFVKGIHRLPPGHWLLLRDGRLTTERYWAIDPTRETRYRRDEEYVEHFRTLFQEAVRCRLRSAFPIATFLSGGLDSSAITCMAAAHARVRLEAFTVFSDDPLTDERCHARAIIQATGITGHELYRAGYDPLDGLDENLRQLESPIVAETGQAARPLWALLRAQSCGVVLSGDGGDQLLDEYGYLADLLSKRPWRFLPELRAFATWMDANHRELALLALQFCLPEPFKFWGKRIQRRVPPSWINPHLAREVGLRERIREPRHRARFPSFAQAASYLLTTSPYYLLKLEVEEREFSLRGIEHRYPYLDSRLVEFILSIPWDRRTRQGERKSLLRRAMQGVVPDTIRLRRGKGADARAMDRALTALCRLDPPAPLANLSGRMGRYLNFKGAENLVRRYLSGAHDLRHDVWFLVTLDRWLTQLEKGDICDEGAYKAHAEAAAQETVHIAEPAHVR